MEQETKLIEPLVEKREWVVNKQMVTVCGQHASQTHLNFADRTRFVCVSDPQGSGGTIFKDALRDFIRSYLIPMQERIDESEGEVEKLKAKIERGNVVFLEQAHFNSLCRCAEKDELLKQALNTANFFPADLFNDIKAELERGR